MTILNQLATISSKISLGLPSSSVFRGRYDHASCGPRAQDPGQAVEDSAPNCGYCGLLKVRGPSKNFIFKIPIRLFICYICCYCMLYIYIYTHMYIYICVHIDRKSVCQAKHLLIPKLMVLKKRLRISLWASPVTSIAGWCSQIHWCWHIPNIPIVERIQLMWLM